MANGQSYPYEKRNIDEELNELANNPVNPTANNASTPAPNTQLLKGLPDFYEAIRQSKLNLDPEVIKEYLPSSISPELVSEIFNESPIRSYVLRRDGTFEPYEFKSSPNLPGLSDKPYILNGNNRAIKRKGEPPEYVDDVEYFKRYPSPNSPIIADLQSSAPNTELLEGLPTSNGLSENANTPPTSNLPSPASNPELLECLPTPNGLSENVNPTQIANKNNLNGYYQPPQRILSPREYGAQQRVYELKTAWRDAQEKIDVLNNLLSKTTDEKEKKDYQAQINELKRNQKIYADSAAVVRNAAGAMGWDMTGMGAENTFDEMTQLMKINQYRGMTALADMPSTREQKFRVYADLVQNGARPDMARQVAEMFHDEFRENTIRQLMSGIRVYGTNGDGSLNEFGQMLAGKLYNENPYMYGNVVNGFASPKDIFGVNATLKNTQLSNEGAMQRQMASLLSAKELAELDRTFQKWRTEYTVANENARHDKDVAVRFAELEENKLYHFLVENRQERESTVPEIAYRGWYNYLMRFGTYTEEEATKRAKEITDAQILRSQGKDNSQHREVMYNIIGGQFELVKNALRRKDTEEAKAVLMNIRMILKDPVNNQKVGLLTPEEISYCDKLWDIYNKVAEKEITFEEALKQLEPKEKTPTVTSRNWGRGKNKDETKTNPNPNANDSNAASNNSKENNSNVKVTSVNPYTGQTIATVENPSDKNKGKEDKPKSDPVKEGKIRLLQQQGYNKLNLTHFKDRKVPPEVWYNFGTRQIDIINWDELDSKTQEEVKTALGNLFTLN